MKPYVLRPEQQEIVDYCAENRGKRIALCAPTAFGKTVVAHNIATNYPGRVAIITYANELVKQFRDDFPFPYIIGKSHYLTKRHYDDEWVKANTSKICLFNPVSYLRYLKSGGVPFDCVLMDEADACLGLFLLTDGTTCDMLGSVDSAEVVYNSLMGDGQDFFAEKFKKYTNRFWWEVKTQKVKGKERRVLYVRPLELSRDVHSKLDCETIVAMSGTLLPSSCKELFGTTDYVYRELPSPIPVEARRVEFFCDREYPDTIEGLKDLLSAALEKYPERPAIVHTTYAEASVLGSISGCEYYLTKDDKIEALRSIQGTGKAMLSAGATTGLSLDGDKCNLNIILRGAFANLGSDFVRRRKAIEGGNEWYTQQVLRHAIQACGRSTRTPTDKSRIVISDNRLSCAIFNNLEILPKYFVESLGV